MNSKRSEGIASIRDPLQSVQINLSRHSPFFPISHTVSPPFNTLNNGFRSTKTRILRLPNRQGGEFDLTLLPGRGKIGVITVFNLLSLSPFHCGIYRLTRSL